MSFDAQIAGNVYSLPGTIVSFTASGSISRGQVVKVTGPMTVAVATAGTDISIGVAVTSASSGQKVSVLMNCPIVWLTASGTVNAGNLLKAASGGAVQSGAVGTLGYAIGIALDSVSSGNVLRVALTQMIIPAS